METFHYAVIISGHPVDTRKIFFIKFVSLCNTITTHKTHTHNIQYNKLAQITKDLNLYIGLKKDLVCTFIRPRFNVSNWLKAKRHFCIHLKGKN